METIIGGILLAATFALIALEERRRQLAEGTFYWSDGLPHRVSGQPPEPLNHQD